MRMSTRSPRTLGSRRIAMGDDQDSGIDLAGHVAIVTGGGRGIGRAIALGLSSASASVGVVARQESDRDDSFPHFTSNFRVNGVTYNFTMIGRNPRSVLASTIRSTIIPLRMNFTGFGTNGDVSV